MKQPSQSPDVTNTLQIFCKNNKKSDKFPFGTTLLQIYQHFQPELVKKPLCAAVNNQLHGLNWRVFGTKQVEFLDCTTSAGRKVYMRSLMFVLYKAVEDLYPGTRLTIEAPVSKGYYFLLTGTEATLDVVQRLRQRMREIIAEGHRFERFEGTTEEVAQLFRKHGQEDKALLIEGQGQIYCCYFRLGQTYDNYYGPLVPSTDFLDEFDLVRYYDGILLRIPREGGHIPEIVKQEKMLQAFREAHLLQDRIGMTTVGHLNESARSGQAGDAIKVAEALQEKNIARIADQIADRPDVRIVLIAGPSSSGKTTFSKRLCVQLMACGLMPRLISLDNYFLDREKTPRDEKGDYDFEHIEALNLPLFQQHLRQLLRGETVELPRYDFPTGTSQLSGQHLHLDPGTLLVMEGIHALNPRLLADAIPPTAIFRIYVSALTSIKLDGHNYISTTINRLLRRIVRDYKYRGTSARQTLERWPSVRSGEEKWIYPYQENADVMFNSALIYELAVLRNYAIPLLETVPENCEDYMLAQLLIRFLRYFEPISDKELPPTSLLREFLGGSSFHY